MVLNTEWKIDSGCYPFLNTTGGGESVQHIFILSLSSSLGTSRIRAKQVPQYLDLVTHKKCWIKGWYRGWPPHQPKLVCPISLTADATQRQGWFEVTTHFPLHRISRWKHNNVALAVIGSTDAQTLF